jgi:hypothetical protein
MPKPQTGNENLLVGEKDSVNGDLEWFSWVGLDLNLDNFPSFSLPLNKGALRGGALLTVHVEVDLFRSGIAVVSKHDLLGRSHIRTPIAAGPGNRLPAIGLARFSVRVLYRARQIF